MLGRTARLWTKDSIECGKKLKYVCGKSEMWKFDVLQINPSLKYRISPMHILIIAEW
jgi:hypothetical protein